MGGDVDVEVGTEMGTEYLSNKAWSAGMGRELFWSRRMNFVNTSMSKSSDEPLR